MDITNNFMEVKNMNIDITTLRKLPKYRENLLVSDDYIFSYLTKVGVIDHENATSTEERKRLLSGDQKSSRKTA